MGYTKKAQATRRRIVETASELFFKKGYSRTKLDEILMISKVRKGNFYYYFRSKEDLGLAVIRESGRPILIDWVNSLFKAGQSGRDALAQLTGRIMESELVLSGAGNPLSNLAFELADYSEDFRKELRSVTEEIVAVIEAQFARFVAEGGRLSGAPRQCAEYMVGTLEGGMLMYKLSRDRDQLRFAVDMGLGCLIVGDSADQRKQAS